MVLGLYWRLVDNEKRRMELTWIERINWLVEKLQSALNPLVGALSFTGQLAQELRRAKPLWVETFMHLWQEFYSHFTTTEFVRLREEAGSKVQPPNFWAIHFSHIQQAVERRVDQIFSTLEERWLAEPVPSTPMELVERIRGSMTEHKKLIAQVEVLLLVGQAGSDVIEAIGPALFELVWITQDDERIRSTHRFQHGMTRPVGTPFPNGLLYPGDESTGDPSEYCGCRCVPRYQMKVRGSQDATSNERSSVAVQALRFPFDRDRPDFEGLFGQSPPN